jgi:hypothetical protein
MKRVDVLAVRIIPEMIFYKHLHSDLSFWHAGIIKDEGLGEAKEKLKENDDRSAKKRRKKVCCIGERVRWIVSEKA